MVDAFVLKLSIKLALVSKEYKLLIQKINRMALTSKAWKFQNFLIALLVLAENLDLPSGRNDQRYGRSTDKGVWSGETSFGKLKNSETGTDHPK